MKTCLLCETSFEKSATGRLRILRKEPKGESVGWICPACSEQIDLIHEGM